MSNTTEKYEDNPDFLEFLNKEFDKTVLHATVEELAEFSFGSFDVAVEAYEQYKRA